MMDAEKLLEKLAESIERVPVIALSPRELAGAIRKVLSDSEDDPEPLETQVLDN